MGKHRIFFPLLVTVLIYFNPPFANGLDAESRKHCCQVGTNYSSNGFDCKTFLPEMVGVIELTGMKSCLSMVDVCCKKRYREILCEEGTKEATTGSCSSEDGEKKECCTACKAGIEAGNNKESCGDFGLGEPYDGVFTSCCNEASTTTISSTTEKITTTMKTTVPLVPNSFDTKPASGLVENICDSDVCAQICEPVGSSFKCDCFKGFTLMEDGVSCKPQKRNLKKGGRCESNNPCDQDCTDTGIAIKCSCREGYKLHTDNRSCFDIDECALDVHDCARKEDCINEIGTYSCYEPYTTDDDINFEDKCPPGYKFDFEKLVCDDIDECLFDLMCVPPKTCKNTVGSFTCEGEDILICPPGFNYKAATQACADIDECLVGDHDCNKESQECLNTKGNYTCVDKASRNTCPPGFKKNYQTQLCEDINECLENPDLCDVGETCVNEPGGHSCMFTKPSITTPTTPRSTTRKTTPSTTTTTKATTTTTTTTARPICPKGYKYVPETHACGDINECQIGLHTCLPLERCDNTIGSYHCSRIYGCGTGYTLNSHNGLCEDDDECILGTHNCKELGEGFECRNTLGSYRCQPGKVRRPSYPNYGSRQTSSTTSQSTPSVLSTTSTPSTTTVTAAPIYPPPTMQQPVQNKPEVITSVYPTNRFTYLTTGYLNASTQSSFPHPTIYFKPKPSSPVILPYSPKTTTTTQHPTSVNFPYVPVRQYPIITGQLKKCLPGYMMNVKGECEDINECASNPCGKQQKCINYNGRFECASPMQCIAGFELDETGEKCIDVNECFRRTHKCNPTQICKNYEGYYTCECPQGYHFNRRLDICEDMDECKVYRPCGFANCINTQGSYRCECKEGFRENNSKKCQDIDECEEHRGLCEQNCVNTWGSYRCSCKAGFILNNSDNRTCTDLDECERFKDRRLCIGTCKNIPGSYACECPSGYKLGSDGRICNDIDECNRNPCRGGEECVNTRGGYKCYPIKCPPNYVKDTDHKSRCKRLQSLCDPRDYKCLLLPEQYTYQFITMVSNLPVTHGQMLLFQITGPQWIFSKAEFTLKILDVNCPYNIKKVDDSYFQKNTNQLNTMALYLVKSIQGPQEIRLQVEMNMYRNNLPMGTAVVYIIIVVSEHPF